MDMPGRPLKNNLKIKYPKFLVLLLTFFIAYLIFYERNYEPLLDFLSSMTYVETFFLGVLYSYGFTASVATSIFMILAKHQNIYLAAVAGGFGSLFSDLVIFKLIRHSFDDEIEKLSKEKPVLFLKAHTPKGFSRYFLPVLACFIIASPLPDEIGVSLFAAIRTLPTRIFVIVSFSLNTIGIFTILAVGSVM